MTSLEIPPRACTSWCDHLSLFLVRRPTEDVPHVILHHEADDTEIRLTLAEVEELRDVLAALVAKA